MGSQPAHTNTHTHTCKHNMLYVNNVPCRTPLTAADLQLQEGSTMNVYMNWWLFRGFVLPVHVLVNKAQSCCKTGNIGVPLNLVKLAFEINSLKSMDRIWLYTLLQRSKFYNVAL